MIPEFLAMYYLGLLYTMLPAYVANMMPVFVKKIPLLDSPMDFGKKIGGIRILGDHKTWRGFVAAVIGGVAIFYLQLYLYQFDFFYRLSTVNYTTISVWLGVLLGTGAIVGDAVKSFFKRRMKIRPGKPWIPFDQIDYTIGALLFALPIISFSLKEAAFIVIVSGVLHIVANYVGYLIGINSAKL